MPIADFDLTNVRYVRFTSTTQAVIPKEPGVSKRIVDIWIDGVPDRTYVDVSIGTTRIARLPLKWNDVTLVSEPENSMNDVSTLQFFSKLVPEFAIEADQDEDITFTFNNTIPALHVVYVVQKPGINKSLLGRSASPNVLYACPVTHSATVNASINFSLDNALVPVGFPSIADGFVVPSGRQFVLKALAFGTAAAGSTTPTRLHIWDERFEFFSPIEHTGISVEAGRNMLSANIAMEDIVKVKDYVIPAGHKITLNFDASFDGTNTIAAGTLALFLIGLWQVVR